MRTNIAVLSPFVKVKDILHSLRTDPRHKQRLLVVVEKDGKLVGITTRGELFEQVEKNQQAILDRPLNEVVHAAAAVANPNETLRTVVYRMAESGYTRMPVVERDTAKLVGLVALDDLLKARSRHLEEEQRRDRPLKLRFLLPGSGASEEAGTTVVH
jgi:chloride channel protein, CIC family